jgi:hypothetical protein
MEGMEIPISRVIIVMFSFLFTYGVGLLPTILMIYFVFLLIGFNVWFFILLPFLLILGFYLFIFVTIGVIWFMVKAFRMEYKEGEYPLTLKNPQVFRYVLYGSFYHPMNWILTELHTYNFKEMLAKAGGAKIGKGVTLGGFIADPCLFEVGDYTVIGGRCEILSHSGEVGKLILKKVKIGKRCLIGQNATIIAGVEMEDGSMLGAGSVVPKCRVLKKGKKYGGVPAREIKVKK